jgi:hypothetical protein
MLFTAAFPLAGWHGFSVTENAFPLNHLLRGLNTTGEHKREASCPLTYALPNLPVPDLSWQEQDVKRVTELM